MVFLFETISQLTIFRHKLRVINDVDHRMEPHSDDDLNGDGIRSEVEADHFLPQDQNIIFLGDSFVYGWNLDADEAVPQQLEALARQRHPELDLNVANFGWVSSSPLLSYRLLRDIGSRYNPDVVLLAVDMSDFEDDLNYRKLLERRGVYRALDWTPISFLAIKKLTRKVPLLKPLHEPVFGYPAQKFFVTANRWQDMLPYYQQIRSSIDAIADYSRNELGAEFVLLLFPRSYQYSDRESPRNWEAEHYEALGPFAHEPFAYFDSIRDEVDYPIYSLLEDFQKTDVFPTCFDFDPHWNAQGSRVAAEAVYRYCLEAGCFGAPMIPEVEDPTPAVDTAAGDTAADDTAAR